MTTKTTLTRIRLTQRILIACSDENPDLLTDHHWQKAMIHIAALQAKADQIQPGRALSKLARFEISLNPSDEKTLHKLEKRAA